MKRIIFAVLLILAFPAYASAYTVTCTNCSTSLVQSLEYLTSYTQLANVIKQYAEDVQQTTQQIRMVQQNVEQYANMVQNTMQLPAQLVSEFRGTFTRLASLSDKLRTQRGDVMALGEIFTEIYQERGLFENLIAAVDGEAVIVAGQQYAEHWDTWSDSVDQATMATFQLTGQQLADMQADPGNFQNYMDQLLSTPEGQMQAIQAGNQLAALQVQESRQLRELVAVQAQSALASQMKAEKESQMGREAWEEITETSDEFEQTLGSENAKEAP